MRGGHAVVVRMRSRAGALTSQCECLVAQYLPTVPNILGFHRYVVGYCIWRN